jgi:hypothetical protein
MAAEVASLRELRDGYLLESALGGAFVDGYYRLSPVAADYIAEHGAARSLVRAVLVPIVWMTQLFLAAPGLLMGLFATFGLLCLLNRRAQRVR